MTEQPTPIDPVAAWLADLERAHWQRIERLIRTAQAGPPPASLEPESASSVSLQTERNP